MLRYIDLVKLNDGGCGSVYRAKDLTTNKRVVIKKISAKSLGKKISGVANKFEREVGMPTLVSKACGGGSVPNVIDSFTEKGYYYIVSEYVMAEDATTYEYSLSLHGGVYDRVLLDLMYKISILIKKMHDAEIVHRDIKLENILIYESSATCVNNVRIPTVDPILIDFDTACTLYDGFYRYDTIEVGTAIYMAPELLDYIVRSNGSIETDDLIDIDIYALGITLYQLTNSGKVPYDLDDTTGLREYINRVIDDTPVYSECGNNDIDRLINRLISKNPLDRPSIDDVCSIIKKCLDNIV